MNKIIVIGQIWKSESNGYVFGLEGVSPTLCVGAHSGVQPKIVMYDEQAYDDGKQEAQ